MTGPVFVGTPPFSKGLVIDAPGLPLRMGHPLGKFLSLSLSLHPVNQPVLVLFSGSNYPLLYLIIKF
jgi:hypothetical protein